MTNADLLAEAPAIIAAGIKNGWVKPADPDAPTGDPPKHKMRTGYKHQPVQQVRCLDCGRIKRMYQMCPCKLESSSNATQPNP